MALHEGMHGKDHAEHMRRMEEERKKRARGGEIDGKEAEDQDEETAEEDKDAEEHGRARGGSVPHRGKKAGGKVEGKHPKSRPDRRARGGATADMNPETTAGKMSSLPFERIGPKPNGGGEGKDRDPD